MHCYEYPKVADITADIAILTPSLDQILLIQRKGDPFAGFWALPGGYLNEGECAEQAAIRELREETGIVVAHLSQFRSFDTPGRDPRGPVLSVVHWVLSERDKVHPKAGDDAADVGWFPTNDLPQDMAFDHRRITTLLGPFLRAVSG